MFDASGLGRPLRAEIDCAAYLRNLERIQTLVAPARVAAVLKADAYGHGIKALSGLLSSPLKTSPNPVPVDLAVASSDEALQLIETGLKNPIWILEGPFSQRCFEVMGEHQVHWVLHSFWQLDLLAQTSQECSCWLKIDTGMHRLGFQQGDIEAIVEKINSLNHCHLSGMFSHFACSDMPDSPVSRTQMDEFEHCLSQIGLNELPKSLANSSAIFNLPISHHDVVRPGIASYCSISSSDNNESEAVMSLNSAVIAIRKIKHGESVGYGHIWTAERDSTIATIAVGYGDGYPRHAPNGTPVLVAGQIAPLVGRVSMDMITVDVTELSGIEVGAEVELWGKRLNINEIAKHADTISYELLTQITQRVPRIYLNHSTV